MWWSPLTHTHTPGAGREEGPGLTGSIHPAGSPQSSPLAKLKRPHKNYHLTFFLRLLAQEEGEYCGVKPIHKVPFSTCFNGYFFLSFLKFTRNLLNDFNKCCLKMFLKFVAESIFGSFKLTVCPLLVWDRALMLSKFKSFYKLNCLNFVFLSPSSSSPAHFHS